MDFLTTNLMKRYMNLISEYDEKGYDNIDQKIKSVLSDFQKLLVISPPIYGGILKSVYRARMTFQITSRWE